MSIFRESFLTIPKRKIEYKYFISNKNLKNGSKVPNEYKDDIDKNSSPQAAVILYIRIFGTGEYFERKDEIVYKNSVSKTVKEQFYIYKCDKNLVIIETVDQGTLEELVQKYLNKKLNPVSTNEYNKEKQVYDFCCNTAKSMCSKSSIINKHVNFGTRYDDDLESFLYKESDEIEIFGADLWDLNPEARTNEELNNKIYNEFNKVEKYINDQLDKKYRGGYKIEYVGDWDGIGYSLYRKEK